MRAILIALVVVNVIWALWGGGSSGEPERSATLTTRSGPQLALLSELPADALQPKTAVSTPDEPGPESPPPAAEVDLEEAVASVDVKEVSADKPQTCLAMGPFDARERAEALRDEVLSAGGTAEVVAEEVAGRPDYLVFIDTTGSRDAARRIREELQAREIDSHIIAGGDLQNALSVGVFSREPLARRQYDRVTDLGYETTVRELPRQHTVYHLMADRPVADASVPSRAACHEIAAAHASF